MAEISRPWSGTVTGDAGPYTDDDWTDIWYRFLGALADADTGVLSNVLNELEVTGVATPVAVDTGFALVDGTFYSNSVAVNVVVPTPAGAVRIDRIVLRKSWAAQTVRITRIAGVEGGGVPALVQVDGTTWDLPLFQASVTVGGVITLTDERERLFTRVPSMTAAQRDAMTAVNGMVIYNESVARIESRVGGAWVSEIPIPARLVPPVTRWVKPGWYVDGNTASAVVAARIYYTPIYVPESVTYDRIGINVSVGDGGGGLADLRIFEWSAGVPGALVLSAGTVSTNAAGAKEIVINQTLQGLYFLAVRVDNTPTIRGPILASGANGALTMPVSGIAASNTPEVDLVVLFDDDVYADPAGVVDGVANARRAYVQLREA